MAEPKADHTRATRRLWPALALPGTLWLIALFLVPIYAVMAVAFSGSINIFGEPIPAWNPLDWTFATFNQVFADSISGPYRAVWIRTAMYTFLALRDLCARRISGRVLHGSPCREDGGA